MAAKFGLLLALGAGAGLLMLAGDSKASTGGGGGSGPGPAPNPLNDDCYDAHAPAEVKSRVYALLQSKDVSPKDLEAASQANASLGFPKIAACLHQKAINRQAELENTIAQRGGMPHIIRYGDIPSIMANYYTGQPMRFKEFQPLNPHIGTLTTSEYPPGSGKQVSNYPGWTPGTEILIPAAWNPLSKPIPPPASGGLKTAGPTPATAALPKTGSSGGGNVGNVVQGVMDAFKIPGQVGNNMPNSDSPGTIKGDWPPPGYP